MVPTDWNDEAAIVIIGGGVVGCSIAYHCAREGLSDILLIERGEIGAATTARTAGQVSSGRTDPNMLRMQRHTFNLIPDLEDEVGEPLDFRRVGNLRVGFSAERAAELAKLEAPLSAEGIPFERLDAPAARELCPWLDMSDAGTRLWLPDAGIIDGTRLAAAYARAARGRGVRIQRGVSVIDVVREGPQVIGVRTASGTVRAQHVVDAAGAWSAVAARAAGTYAPAAPTRSHYWVTAPHRDGVASQPILSLPDFKGYTQPFSGGLLVGFSEPASKTFDPFTLPDDVDFAPLFDPEADQEQLVVQLDPMRSVAPSIDEWRFSHHIAGLCTYTPDGKFAIGAFEGLSGFMIATGCSGAGVAASGGIGRLIAELLAGQAPFVDPHPFRPDRFGTVDPASEAFRAACSAARAGKWSGAVSPR
ncbi:NAD(P)/FAD-dependent oxidoreductase [Chelatococcus asaccharovorans]|uniref:4-methylaminobutanoate oxidase (Formaldehyde-forming) n=1 Tax=Chelatococcus asaccharovorans TaxID=28210 RepID=A0A2V3UD27_9HYPH|nr:FAD-binding oxidoreductase [Chelatococcus asaccharovorans]MBS7706964.1 FAD-binding oxidoreductase [Chelatococcus asaccharovorans]PXW63143.1 4-methylaminobutanoate oxidase (formaldehyde-forming) [Chelatococcus asaccharovorans]